MPSSATNTPALHVLRSILRNVRSTPKQSFPKESNSTAATSTHISSSHDGGAPIVRSTRNPLEEHVLNLYRASKDLSPTSAAALSKRKMAYNFHVLKRDLKERGRLHELDGGAEIKLSPKELSRRAAARAGLQLPEESSL